MTYADFTLDSILEQFKIGPIPSILFPDLKPVEMPSWLMEMLNGSPLVSSMNEKARSEFLIAPILVAVSKLSGNRVAVFSGVKLNVEPLVGLAGECDFILSDGPPILPLRSPLIAVLEAKRGDIELGMGQCTAQMIAASRFNAAAGQTNRAVYGCVTSAEIWQFMRLKGALLEQHSRRYYLDDIENILAMFLAIIGSTLAHPQAQNPPAQS